MQILLIDSQLTQLQSDLSYDCKCSDNSSAPGLEYYKQTMPTFICNELFSQCNAQNVGDSRGQDECETEIRDQCGTLTPPARGSNDDDEDDDDSSTSTSASATTSPTETSSSDDADNTSDDDSLAAAGAAPRMAMAVGAGLFVYLI